MSKNWLLVAVSVCSILGAGCGHIRTSADARVAALEAKVAELEHKLRVVESELARTPRLGLQSARRP
jgi:hypothetical protein